MTISKGIHHEWVDGRKVCPRCLIEKGVDGYPVDKRRSLGRASTCILCERARSAAKYKARVGGRKVRTTYQWIDGYKICQLCEVSKPQADYHRNGKNPPSWTSNCKPCERKLSLRGQIEEEYTGIPCLDCGGVFGFECMDFDHVRGTKIKGVSAMASLYENEENRKKIDDEIAKCELICSNCHRTRTKDRWYD